MGENCNDWPRTVMTGGCLLVAFAPDGATGNHDDDEELALALLFGDGKCGCLSFLEDLTLEDIL